MKIYEIHEKVFALCFETNVEQGGQLKFSLRKSNRYDRLENGHWFYGNDDYVAVSFWSGSDWKNKTPNIFFGIYNNGYTFLEISATDSERKYSFFKEVVVPQIEGMEVFGTRWRKQYSDFKNDYLASLQSFLEFEKALIDTLISYESDKYFGKEDTSFNRIGFIETQDFEKRLKNVIKYRTKFNPKNIRKKLPEHLKSFQLTMSFPKINVSLENMPSTAQWIFLTGLNGTGKTNILRGITAAIVDNFDNEYLINDGTFLTNICIRSNHRIVKQETKLQDSKRKGKRITKGFAAYGSSRLTVMDFPNGVEVRTEDIIKKCSMTYSIFHGDGYLFTIDPVFLNHKPNPILEELGGKPPEVLTRFTHQIVELLPDIIPNLVSIIIPKFNSNADLWSLIEYVEEDENGEKFPPVEFNDLSSGAKSMIAMFGDMLVRLSIQQPKIEDFSEFTGIVIIDEIDVHLHPKIQRLIIEKLTGVFPKIQFIVSTHSPIPLLGAPKGSVFYRVERTAEEGVTVKRLEQIEKQIGNLLPNTILTSPIFDFDLLDFMNDDRFENLQLEDDYKNIQKNFEIEKRLKKLDEKILPKNLFIE